MLSYFVVEAFVKINFSIKKETEKMFYFVIYVKKKICDNDALEEKVGINDYNFF